MQPAVQPRIQPREIAVLRPARHCAEIILQLDADLFWFAGHFPQQALLPGVAQLDWAMGYASQLLASGYHFQRIRQIKFQSPLLPDQRVSLRLEWQPISALLAFSYLRCGQIATRENLAAGQGGGRGDHDIICSSGKIQLCR